MYSFCHAITRGETTEMRDTILTGSHYEFSVIYNKLLYYTKVVFLLIVPIEKAAIVACAPISMVSILTLTRDSEWNDRSMIQTERLVV